MTCALFAALVLLADAGASNGEGARTDLYGDPLPPGAVARLGTIRLRHSAADVSFSKDGKQLISCGRDGEVRTWDVATGKLVRRQRLAWKPWEKEEFTTTVTLSPDGTIAALLARTALNSATRLYLCDTSTGAEYGRLAEVNTLAFSVDGKVLAVQRGGADGWNLELWKIAEGKIRLFRKISSPQLQEALVFAPSGRYLAGRSWKYEISDEHEDEVRLWDVATGAEISKHDRGRTRGLSLAFSADSKTLAVGSRSKGRVRLLDTTTFKEKAVLPTPANVKAKTIGCLTFSSDARWLAASYDSADSVLPPEYGVLLWDVAGTDQPRRLPESFDNRLTFAPDGKTLACNNGFSSEIRLWDVASGRRLHHRPGHAHFLRWRQDGRLIASPDGQLVASSTLDGLCLWKAATGELLPSPRLGTGWGDLCLFSPDSKALFSVGTNGSLQAWDVAAGKSLRCFETRRPVEKLSRFLTAGSSSDGKRLAAIVYPDPAELLVWEVATGRELSRRPYRIVQRVTNYFALSTVSADWQAAFAPDCESVAVLRDESAGLEGPSWRGLGVVLEEVATRCVLAKLPKDVGLPVVFSPWGRLVAAPTFRKKKDPFYGDEATGLALIEAATGTELLRLEIGSLDFLAITPDGRGTITADRSSLSVWDVDTGERMYRLKWPDGIASHIQYLTALPGGRVATAMTEGDILIWDLEPSTWPVRKPMGDLSGKQLASLWSDLAGDARTAHQAIYTLARTPVSTVLFFTHRLLPAAVDTKHVEKLLADLANEQFEAREAASRELGHLRDQADPMIRRALEGRPSLEMRRRLQAILAQPKRPSPEALRSLRAITVLERIGTPEARRILEKLSGGADVRETREAKAALQRLKRLTD